MSYGLVARCPRTGQFGIAVASYSIAVGLHGDGLRANTGAAVTLGSPKPGNNALALRLLAQGFMAKQVVAQLVANDPHAAHRQIAVCDREGGAAVHSGAHLRVWSGHRIGTGYAAFGDMLAGPGVVDALAANFEAEAAVTLEDRLLVALAAGRDAGGLVGRAGRLPERSAAVIVYGTLDYSDFDLRVDLHDGAIDELKRIEVEYRQYAAYYVERGKSPRQALPQMEFADLLKGQQAAR
jgi:uncharacterized Ntn-hydrolase superfamily protein